MKKRHVIDGFILVSATSLHSFILSILPRRQHMRTVLALGAAIISVGTASLPIAQERLQSNKSGMGVGAGVGGGLVVETT